ncbi:MAG TPA: hypothetical protein VIY07_08105 [Pseudolabrys sp.]
MAIANIGWLNADHTLAARFEIRQQCSIVGADIDDQVLAGQTKHAGALALQVGKIVPQQFRRATGVRILRRKDDGWIHREPELNKLAVAAM